MIITCQKLITYRSSKLRVIDQGSVVIHRGIIEAAGSQKLITQRFPDHQIIHLQNAVLMPGLVNIHAHLELPLLLQNIRSRTLPDWVLGLLEEKRHLTRKDYSAAAEMNISTLIKSGTTTVGEICTHRVSPSLLKRKGLRAVVFNEIIGMAPGKQVHFPLPPRSALVETGLSPHSPFTVSENTLRSISRFSREKRIKLAMHVAESRDELRLLRRERSELEKIYQFAQWDLSWAPKGSSPVAYLHRIGFLSPRILAVHCVQLVKGDFKLLKKSGAAVAHCPRSNKELTVGRMPLKKMLNAGIPVGLGTDSLASVPSLSLWDEMRYALRIHRRDGITARDIFSLATMGGAYALGLNREIGSIEPGKKADIIAVPLPLKNTGDLYSDLLRETNSCIMSMVNGKILYRR